MDLTVEALQREGTGTGPARRMRREGRVPAVVYGEGEPKHISVDARHLDRHLHDEAFRSSVLTLKIEDREPVQALLRDLQRHPFRREVLHADFLEISQTREINANVPLHFINAESSPGVKLHHGIMTVIENEVEIHCLPKHLPEFVEVDVGSLEVGMSVHLSELPVPEGVRFIALSRGADPALAIVSEPAKVDEDEAASDETSAATSEGGESEEKNAEQKDADK